MSKNWIFRLVILLLITSFPLLGGNEVTLKKHWLDFQKEGFSLDSLFKEEGISYILYCRTIDCFPCIRTAIKALKKIEDNPAAIVGYVHEEELGLLRELKGKVTLLRDHKYELFRKLKLRQITPVLLKIDRNRRVLNIIDFLEIKKSY
jgi:hypothetical protein